MKKEMPGLVEVFEKHFKANMKNKDVESFKRDYPTLYVDVILHAMMDISRLSVEFVNQNNKQEL